MTSETLGGFLRRKHPKLYRRFTSALVMSALMGGYVGFFIGLLGPGMAQGILGFVADRANEPVLLLLNGLALGFNITLVCYLASKRRRARR